MTAIAAAPRPVPVAKKPDIKPRGVLPPAVIVGGGAGALSIARSLGRRGIPVFALNFAHEYVRYCRYVRWIPRPNGRNTPEGWLEFLLSEESDYLRGSVLLAASDAALELFIEHRTELAARFKLDLMNEHAQLCMLNKLSTYKAAIEAGVPTPSFLNIRSFDDLVSIEHELVFPLVVKPQVGYSFEERFGVKHLTATSIAELRAALQLFDQKQIEIVLMEKIEGPDDLLCSLYTYLDESGTPLFELTKRVIRRYPVNMGAATYHVTDWNPEVARLGQLLLQHVGLQGLANVEFKRDLRDGQLKLIECNARFTAPIELLARSGIDLALLVYNQVAGIAQPPLTRYKTGQRLWFPIEDWKAYRQMRRAGSTTLFTWLKSIWHRQSLPYFQWTDPRPSLQTLLRRGVTKLRRPAKKPLQSDLVR